MSAEPKEQTLTTQRERLPEYITEKGWLGLKLSSGFQVWALPLKQ